MKEIPTENTTFLTEGNLSLRKQDYDTAIRCYLNARHKNPELKNLLDFNIQTIMRRAKIKNYWLIYAEITRSGEPEELSAKKKQTEDTLIELRKKYDALTLRPLVSVIMPTHNRASIIKKSIVTVLEQSYVNLELLICDDGSSDDSETIIKNITDDRIRYFKLPKGGAASARNAGLKNAHGTIIAYLDSDNYWHPDYLLAMVTALQSKSGHSAIYCNYIDFHINENNSISFNPLKNPAFSHEALLARPFIDLNSFIHFRELYDCYGGFNPELRRRQDYDLMLKYTWLRDPIHLECMLTLYQRNDELQQITTSQSKDETCIAMINNAVSSYLKSGLPIKRAQWPRKITIISDNLKQNYFFHESFALAEALSRDFEVQLISFQSSEVPVCLSSKEMIPPFETLYFEGDAFPNFLRTIERALSKISGDLIYVVESSLPSLGLALLANQRLGIPIALEINNSETITDESLDFSQHTKCDLTNINPNSKELLSPCSNLWTQVLAPIAKQIPIVVTHNEYLDQNFGSRCLYTHNIKNEIIYDPSKYDRNSIRTELGFGANDRIILFQGSSCESKIIYQLIKLLEQLDDARYKILFIGSNAMLYPKNLKGKYGQLIKALPDQDHDAMMRINFASDLVILWLNPNVPASHFQFPYKAIDAFAMGTPVIANNISALGELARQGYLKEVPFGDWDAIIETISEIFDRPRLRKRLYQAARRLYQRQFSYAAARSNFALIAYRAMLSAGCCVLPVAERFTQHYNGFARQLIGNTTVLLSPTKEIPPVLAASLKIIIKNPTPSVDEIHWGDYHFGRCLTKYLQRLGAIVQTQYQREWQKNNAADAMADAIIVLRGKYPYRPSGKALHLLWCISHPETLTLKECEEYDAVYVASVTHAAQLSRHCSKPVFPLLQCTDLEEFENTTAKNIDKRKGAIFVGNSRGVPRPCVDWAAEVKLDFSIYGGGWDIFGHKQRVVASYINNEELSSLYSKFRFTLNDHWSDMRQMGYVNNRTFDCFAADLPILSDDFPELRAICGDGILYYHDQASFRVALNEMQNNYHNVIERQRNTWKTIRNSFSFESRAKALVAAINRLRKQNKTTRTYAN